MSHITEIVTNMDNADAIIMAALRLGVRVERNAVPRYYGMGEATVCDLVLRLPGKYDLGLVRGLDGSFRFQCDNELLGASYKIVNGQYVKDERGRYVYEFDPNNVSSYGAHDAGRKLLGDNAQNFRDAYDDASTQLALDAQGIPYEREVLTDGTVVYRLVDPSEVGLTVEQELTL